MREKFFNIIKNKKRWIYISAISIIVAAVLFSVFYYFKVYLVKPNFDDRQFNFVSSDAGEYIKPGEKITYTVNYKNTGNRGIEELVVETSVPEHTSFISSDISNISENPDRELAFRIGDVEKNRKGTFYFTVEADNPLDTGTLIKLDGVKFKYRIGEEIINDDISAGLVSEVESSPDLSNFMLEAINENADIVRLGDTIQYKITVRNTGDMDASGVQIRSDPSEYVNIIEDSITGPGKYMDNHVLWEIDKIEAGKSETFSFKVTVKEDLGGEELITNKSILEYRGSVIEKSVEEKLSLFSDLTASEAFIYDANGGELYPGETINARVIVRNTGEKKEENYRVICPIPPAATYISRTGTAEGITWSDEIRGLIWELRDLGAGEEKEITLSMKANENLAGSGGTVTINFKIESSNGTVEMPPKSLNVRGSAALNILVMGDSLIVKSNWVQAFDGLLEANYPHAEYNTVASAVSGEMARGGNARIDSNIAEHNPGIIIIAYGTNDVGPRASGFTGNMESMFIKAKNSGARVFVNLIGPIHGWPGKEGYARYNDAIRQIAARHGVVVIDVLTPLSQNPGGYLSDGMHYTSAGASVVAHTVFSYVSQYLGTIGQRL
jgi:uncharacterized repeat protein (TIGR01451 family)